MTSQIKRGWPVPAGLILLSFIPVLAGASRIAVLSGGGPVTADNARFFASPVPVVVHIIAATTYAILGALQFAPGLRRRRPRWHRVAGRVVLPCGLAVALSGMWMALFYQHPADTGAVLTAIRLVVGAAMATAIVLGFVAVRRRDFTAHRSWMIRAYALGLGAGTQVFTQLPWMLAVGPLDKPSKAVLMAAGWAVNVVVAEWAIRRGRAPRAGRRGYRAAAAAATAATASASASTASASASASASAARG